MKEKNRNLFFCDRSHVHVTTIPTEPNLSKQTKEGFTIFGIPMVLEDS